MLKKAIFTAIILSMVFVAQLHATNINLSTQTVVQKGNRVVSAVQEEPKYKKTNALDLVADPYKFFDKKIKFTGKFDKFTTIGLDYPPVNKEAKNYISFLIKRENVTNYNIPLSELKLIIKREYAEKEMVKIEAGDSIEIYGTVFSTALGDPWVDVEKIVILTSQKTDKVKDEIKE